MKFLNFWVIFALLDPDPDADSESGFIESGSETLPPIMYFTIPLLKNESP